MDDDRTTADDDAGAVTRRRLLAGIGVAGATGALAALHGSPVDAAAARSTAAFPQVLGALTPGLTYLPIDAYAFDNAVTAQNQTRQVDNLTGANPLPTPGTLVAPLLIPSGSVIRQINIAYLGTPTVQVWRRPLATPRAEESLVNATQPAHIGSEPRAESVATGLPVTIQDSQTYTVRVACPAGTSVFGVVVGYEPPKQGFVPLIPPPRALDTRKVGGKLNVDEERTVNLGLPAGSRGAVLNLTITETEGTFGFVSVFAADLAFPGNSSINWSAPNQTLANAVITDVDNAGQIKIRGSVNRTQVVIDVLGAFQ